MTFVDDFVRCLGTMSHSRAGWDYYGMSREQRAKENAEEKAALAEARAIWRAHADEQGLLVVAFARAKPLATLKEISE